MKNFNLKNIFRNNNKNESVVKLNVPYYSQFLDTQDPFWMIRSCGAFSLKSVVEFYGKEFPDVIGFCNKAKENGGYDMKNGWIHDYIVSSALGFGLKCYRKENLKDEEEIISSLNNNNPVIVSVEKRVLEQRRFHLIVVLGYDKENIYYHESESTDKEKGSCRSCPRETFLDYFRGKAIFFNN